METSFDQDNNIDLEPEFVQWDRSLGEGWPFSRNAATNIELYLMQKLYGSQNVILRESRHLIDKTLFSSLNYEFTDGECYIDRLDENNMSGWAVCKDQLLSLYIDGVLQDKIKATGFRDDLKKYSKNGGYCTFSVAIPFQFWDGKPHFIELRSGDGALLSKGKTRAIYNVNHSISSCISLYKNPSFSNDESQRKKNILIVAHNASEKIFGAENSLIDVLNVIDASRYSVHICLPNPHVNYINQIKDKVACIYSTPRKWWSASTPNKQELINFYSGIIKSQSIDLVYVNTIVVPECSIAAKLNNIPSIVHAREAINYDIDLVKLIGLGAAAIAQQVKSNFDYIICNSCLTKDIFSKEGSTALIYNAVVNDSVADPLKMEPQRLDEEVLYVGILSSNIQKKGLRDFFELADYSYKQSLNARFLVFGPSTSLIDELVDEYRGIVESNYLEIMGYFSDPSLAIRKVDIVVNFSHFAESFGRTIVEAASYAKPAIVYDYGALPEVVENKETGYLIPFKSPLKAFDLLYNLSTNDSLYKKLGSNAYQRFHQLFSDEVLRNNINTLLLQCESKEPLLIQEKNYQASKIYSDFHKVSVIIPNYNYEKYLPERLHSIINQTLAPTEIIFLDDASQDNSVAIASKILKDCGIDYKIIANDKNCGVYNQWKKGIEAASCEWIWIAEADDRCELNFLQTLVNQCDLNTSISYAQSKRIDGSGQVVVENNLQHTDALSATKWAHDYSNVGIIEIIQSLAYRNTIPNASAAILRSKYAKKFTDRISNFSACGDWWLYANLLSLGDIKYCSSSLNHFRRHSDSVTAKSKKHLSYLDEIGLVLSSIHSIARLSDMQIGKVKQFIDKDYKIESLSKNSDYQPINDAFKNTFNHDKKAIVFCSTNKNSHFGGSEMLWQELAIRLAESGHKIYVYAKSWQPKPKYCQRLIALNATFIDSTCYVPDIIVDLNPDLVIISTGDQCEGSDLFRVLIDNGIKYGITNQLTKSPKFWRLRDDLTPNIIEAYKKSAYSSFTSLNNKVLMENRISNKLNQCTFIHKNPFHVDYDNPPKYPESDIFNIAVPAKFQYIHKGQDILFDVFKDKKWKSRNLVINFYGEGPDRADFVNKCSSLGFSNFKLNPRVDMSKIWEINHAILMPSRMEGMPIVLISALLSERIAIITDIGGGPELVTHHENGFIASEPSAESLSKAIEDAWIHRHKWKEMGKVSRQKALSFIPKDPIADYLHHVKQCSNISL